MIADWSGSRIQADGVDLAALGERERGLEESLDARDEPRVRRVRPHDLAHVELGVARVRRVDVQRPRRHGVGVRAAALVGVAPDAVPRAAGHDLEGLDVGRVHVRQPDEPAARRDEPVRDERRAAGRARRLAEDEPQAGGVDQLVAGKRHARDATSARRDYFAATVR